MPTIRLEVYHQAAPKRRVLVSIDAAAKLDALHEAIATRLSLVALDMRCCLGETEAEVAAVTDLRDGDASGRPLQEPRP